MPGIVSNSANPHGGGHFTITTVLDGTSIVTNMHDSEALTPLTLEEKELLVRLSIRRVRGQGVTLASLINRVVHGDEATNVKFHTFFGPGAAITKTNIGTAYVNICAGLNGERIAVDLTGCTQFRILLTANLVGTGQFGARCIRDGDSAVLYENTNIGAAGERDVDTGWQPLPAAFEGQGLTFLRVQAKSTVAADDPAFRRCCVGFS